MKKLIKNQFEETDYKKFLPLASVLYTSSKLKRNLTSQRLALDDNAFKTIEETLKPIGFRRVSRKFKHGVSALVYEANDHQMLRIVTSKAEEPERLDDSCVLRPLLTMRCGRGGQFTIELLPKVHTLKDIIDSPELSKAYHLGEKDFPGIAVNLMAHLVQRKPPKLFYDPCPENIAIIRHGNINVPLVLDPGAMVNVEDMFDPIVKNSDETFSGKFIQRCDVIPELANLPRSKTNHENLVTSIYISHLLGKRTHEYDYDAAQKYYLRSLKLRPEQANYVVTDEELDAFVAERKSLKGMKYDDGTPYDPQKSVYVRMIKDKGYYPRQFQQFVNDSVPSGKGFCHDIETARRQHKAAAAQDQEGEGKQ